MITILYLIITAVSVFLFSVVGTRLTLALLTKTQHMDVPNERSNHSTPVPRGGGIAVMFASISFMFICDASASLLTGALLLCVVSYIDDRRGLPPRWRFVAQVAAVCLALDSFHGMVFQGVLPYYLDKLVVAIVWLWFVNLFNFMDGIDGISVNQVTTNAIGMILLYITVRDQTNTLPLDVVTDSIIIGSAMLGFLVYNRHPAKIFLGDVGSIPLGYIMGYLFCIIASNGYLAAACILPAYYVADATFTLIMRMKAGKKIWQAHSEHAYQRAVRSGKSHNNVVYHLFATNLVLVILAVVSTLNPYAGVICVMAAYALAFFMMRYICQPAVSRQAVVA